MTISAVARNADTPWIAAHFAVLDEVTGDVTFHVDLDMLATKRTRHDELVVHAVNVAFGSRCDIRQVRSD
jgi:hypothetical protein